MDAGENLSHRLSIEGERLNIRLSIWKYLAYGIDIISINDMSGIHFCYYIVRE